MSADMSASERIRTLLCDLRAEMRARDEIRAEWGPVISRYEDAAERIEQIQRELAEAMTEAGVDLVEDESYSVTLVRPDRGEFDPERLPQQVRAYPGVLRVTVDRRAVERAIRAGLVRPEEVEAAWVSKPVTPFVRVKILEASNG